MNKQLALCAAIVLATAGVARADGPNLIEIRQTGMDLQAGTFAGINAVAAAKGDVKTLEVRAKAIQRFAALIPTLFPKGSETGSNVAIDAPYGRNTNALPKIWSDMAGFQNAAAELGQAAAKLAELAKAGDADGLAAQIKVVGGTCAACHNTYRAKL